MEETRESGKRQFSLLLDDEDFAEVERIARARRSNISQVIREFVVAGIERDRRLQATEAVA